MTKCKLSALLLAVMLLPMGVLADELPDEVPGITISPITTQVPDEEPEPTAEPTAVPTAEPTAVPTIEPTAEPTASPTIAPTAAPTKMPCETESPYMISFTVPSGWTSDQNAEVVVRIADSQKLGWDMIEYKHGGSWKTVTNKVVNGKLTLSVNDNATLTVRITDPHGHTFEESTTVNIFDRTAPTVRAGINKKDLKIRASDDLSGLAGVQVNGLLFTTFEEDSLIIGLDENLNRYERLAVRAFDYAGNFSDPVTLDNPYYKTEAEATATPKATATPTPTPQVTASATSMPTTEKTAIAGAGASSVYTQAAATATPQIVYVTPVPTPEPIIQTEYIPIGPGMPYRADGNSHTLDVLYSAATNKQFITVQSKSGNTFYLVIDYDKPIDEDAEMYETYFLNLVDERDLLALMDGEEIQPTPTPTPQVIYATPEPTAKPTPTAVPVQTEPKNDNTQLISLLILLTMLAGGGIAAFLYLKSKDNRSSRKPEADFEFEEEDEDEE